MKLAYVSGPYRALTEWGLASNIHRAESVGVLLLQMGYSVIIPHKNTAHMGGVIPDEQFLEMDLEQLRRCDVIVMLPNWITSSGAKRERDEANRVGIPVRYWPEDADKLGEGVQE